LLIKKSFNGFYLCRALEVKVDAKQYPSESINEIHERFKDFSVARTVIQEELVQVSVN
jgi:hypothetical protein